MDESRTTKEAPVFKSIVSPISLLFLPLLLLICFFFLQRDVWSYGVTCFEIVARSLPYPDMQLTDVAVGVVKKGLMPSFPSTTPSALMQVISPCFAQRPEQRPSAVDIRDQLHGLS
jgi:serine/threonine protein kinase